MDTVTLIGLIFVEVLLLVFIVSLLKSRRVHSNRDADSLTVFLLSFALWAGFNYLSNRVDFHHDQMLLVNRLLFVFSAFLTTSLFVFIGIVTKKLKFKSWQMLNALLFGLI